LLESLDQGGRGEGKGGSRGWRDRKDIAATVGRFEGVPGRAEPRLGKAAREERKRRRKWEFR